MTEKKKLRIRLLGTPKLFWDEKPITIHRKLARFLIYYLSIQKVMLGRTEIALDFWPDAANSRQNLRDLLSKARQELPDPKIILTDRDWVGLDHNLVEVDVLAFEELYQQLTLPFLSVENQPLPETIFRKMITAVNMWETPNFISGVGALNSESLEDWTYKNNRRLQNQRQDLMIRISQHLFTIGDFEGALSWLSQVIQLDYDYAYPIAVYLKIEVLFRLQRFSQAYTYGRQIVEEMGYDWLGRYEGPLRNLMAQIEEYRLRTPEIISVAYPSEASNQIPLTGVQPLFRNLQMASQRGGVIFLRGESGSGKTRILQEFANQTAYPGQLLYMSANYFQREISYHPILNAFRKILKEKDWRSLEPFWGAQLIPLFPELQHYWSGALTDDSFVINNPPNIQEALHQLLRNVANKGKVTLILDDAQWADTDTLNLLIYLEQRHLFTEKGFLIVAARPEHENALLREILLQQYTMEPFSLVEIEPMSLPDISQIGYSIFRKPISEKLAKRIQAACAGNALFVIETMRAIAEVYSLQEEEEITKLPLSGTVHAILRNRINRLPILARQVAECAAIIGDPFTFPELQMALEMDEMELINGIDALLLSGIVTIETLPFLKHQYRFKFDFLREVITLEASKARKQLLHLRLAKALEKNLEKVYDSQLLVKIADHFSEAGEPVTAFNYWIRYAQNLYTTFSERPAFEAYQNAQQIANSVTQALSSAQLYDLYIGWGDLALSRFELDIADRCFKKATLEGQKRNDPFLLGAGYSGMGELFGIRGIFFQANQYLDHAANFLNLDHFGEFLRVKNRKASLLVQQSMPSQAIAILEGQSVYFPQARTKFDFLMIAESKYYLANANLYAGDFKAAFEICLETAKILSMYRNPLLQSRLELLLGLLAYSRGQFQKSLEHYGASLQISEFYSAWNLALQAATLSSHTSLKLGKIFNCWDQIKNSFHLAEVYKYSGNHGLIFNAQGRVFLYLGKLELAKEYFDQALCFSLPKFLVLFNQLDLGFTQFLLGDPESALTNLEEVVQLCKLYGFRSIELIARSQILLLSYNLNPQAEIVNELADVTHTAIALEIAGAGSSLAYVLALEAIRNSQFAAAEAAIADLHKIGQREESLWLKWHALELTCRLRLAQGLDPHEDKAKRDDCVRRISHMIPKEIRKTIKLTEPPLAGMV